MLDRRIRGYGAVVREWSAIPIVGVGDAGFAAHAYIPAPSAIELAPGIFADCDHDPSTAFASIAAGNLQVWRDAAGLAFEAMAPEGAFGDKILDFVWSAGGRGSSITFDIIEKDCVGPCQRELVRLRVTDLTICARGAFLSAVCWTADMPVVTMNMAVRRQQAAWTEGLAARAARAMAAQARPAQPTPRAAPAPAARALPRMPSSQLAGDPSGGAGPRRGLCAPRAR